MRECLRRGIKPSSNAAPHSIADAQRQFFGIYNGKLSSIDERQRTSLAENILLVATGSKTNPSLSIIDRGEGQTPKRIPETLLSLTKDNRLRFHSFRANLVWVEAVFLDFVVPNINYNF